MKKYPPRAVGRRLADYVVLAHDPNVPAATAGYWEISRASFDRLDTAVGEYADGIAACRQAYLALVADPADPELHNALAARLTEELRYEPETRRHLAELAAEADSDIWLDIHLGSEHVANADDIGLDDVRAIAASRPPDQEERQLPADRDVHIVIPFRDRVEGGRARNLLACLLALRDQDYRDGAVRVTLVETDSTPAWRRVFAPLVNRYVFAPHGGSFNKSWAVNVGIMADGRARGTTCVLDADILTDRSFVSRNVARFAEKEQTGHVCCRYSLSLDRGSTAFAIDRRCRLRQPDVSPDSLRGVLLREPPGGALWARTDVLRDIGGFDERFEGWGGEDEDVTRRLAAAGAFGRYQDQLLHLDHPRPVMRNAENRPHNGHIRMGSWDQTARIGDPDKYRARG
ncbi:glycosyltransferase family 2 protein [Streptacidiphilus sp. PAMC 29251]